MASMISGVEVAVGYPAVTYVTSAARDSFLHVANTELIASMVKVLSVCNSQKRVDKIATKKSSKQG
jgi:hypothetical protein